ncbi:hypothetical protein HYW32_02285 [Candidatus Berkelbacteria bacterium]|nr:hypothetical protein [Candidatus Berkelbacteria bacterium]
MENHKMMANLFTAGIPIAQIPSVMQEGNIEAPKSPVTIAKIVRQELGVSELPKVSEKDRWRRMFGAWLQAEYGQSRNYKLANMLFKEIDIDLDSCRHDVVIFTWCMDMDLWWEALVKALPYPLSAIYRIVSAASYGGEYHQIHLAWIKQMLTDGELPASVHQFHEQKREFVVEQHRRLLVPIVAGRGEAMVSALRALLTEREYKVLAWRVGLEPWQASRGLRGSQSRTYLEVATELGIRKERVRQIEAKALRALREGKVGKPTILKDFVENFWGEDVIFWH